MSQKPPKIVPKIFQDLSETFKEHPRKILKNVLGGSRSTWVYRALQGLCKAMKCVLKGYMKYYYYEAAI